MSCCRLCVCFIPLSSFILWDILCTDRALIDLAVDMASRVWCRAFKATRKNARNIPRKKKNPFIVFWLLSWIPRGIFSFDLLWYIDITLVTLTNPRLRLPQRDIFNIQTTHCSNSALANLVVAGATSLRNITSCLSPCVRAGLFFLFNET